MSFVIVTPTHTQHSSSLTEAQTNVAGYLQLSHVLFSLPQARETVDLLKQQMPDFSPPSLPNSPDLKPVDYAVCWILQERVYKHHQITDVEELRQRVEVKWETLDQQVTDNEISEWCKRLTSLHCS